MYLSLGERKSNFAFLNLDFSNLNFDISLFIFRFNLADVM